MTDFEKWFYTEDAEKFGLYPDMHSARAAWNYQETKLKEMDEVIKLQDTDLRKYEKQIESLKAQLAVYKEDMAKDAEKIVELTNKIEKPCRWCGFENKRGAND